MVEKVEEAEVSYYSDQSNVRVTNKRVIIGNTTYSMANITSISTHVEKPSLTGPILFMFIGVSLLFMGLAETPKSGGAALIGVIVGGLGYFWFRGCKPISHLRIASASGESTLAKICQQRLDRRHRPRYKRGNDSTRVTWWEVIFSRRTLIGWLVAAMSGDLFRELLAQDRPSQPPPGFKSGVPIEVHTSLLRMQLPK